MEHTEEELVAMGELPAPDVEASAEVAVEEIVPELEAPAPEEEAVAA